MNAHDILKYGDRTLLSTIDGLVGDQWTTEGACGIWSVKDIIAHLTSYEWMLVDVLNSLISAGTSTVYLEEMGRLGPENFNDVQVGKRKATTPEEALAEYQDAHARVMALITQISPEKAREVGTLPWYGAEYSLDDFLVYTYYGHKREHSGQIAVFRDRFTS